MTTNPSHDDLPARSLRAVWHPCTQMQLAARTPPLPIARGQGPWLFDTAGRRYFDALSSWWVNLFGHADARLNAAVKDQLDTLPHAMLAGCTHEPAVQLAERLGALTGGALGHAFFASDGASAVEIALKMSFHSWRNRGQGDKREFICLRGGYHGETLGALAVTDVAVFRDAYDPLLMRAHLAPSPDARAAAPGEDAAAAQQRDRRRPQRLLRGLPVPAAGRRLTRGDHPPRRSPGRTRTRRRRSPGTRPSRRCPRGRRRGAPGSPWRRRP